MNVIIETTPNGYQGVTEFVGAEFGNVEDIAPIVTEGNRSTVLELTFDGRTLAVWSVAHIEPIHEIPAYIMDHANAYALLLNESNDYPYLDWIDHTEETA